ncbi:MAG: ATP-dependent Clp protease proteolytic subunit [Candidatus Paceibacterota bacterium]
MKDIYSVMLDSLGISETALAKNLTERRLIPLRGKINEDMADGIIKIMLALDFKEVAPITLLIASSGGDVGSGKHICGAINMVRSPVDGLVIERCASMAVDILLSCRERRALPTAKFFVHFTRTGFECVRDSDEISDQEIVMIKKQMTDDKKEREDLYMKRLKKSREEIHELFRLGEKYRSLEYTAQEALGLGFINKIETDFKFFGHDEEVK